MKAPIRVESPGYNELGFVFHKAVPISEGLPVYVVSGEILDQIEGLEAIKREIGHHRNAGKYGQRAGNADDYLRPFNLKIVYYPN